jgi:hypothetical protein
VKALNDRGCKLEVLDHEGQCYVFVPAIEAPTPPWDRAAYDILIAIPAAYDRGALDAFYLGLPYTHGGATHPRIENGGIITVNDRQWRAVSWHYLDGKPWVAGKDTLETHVIHCKGFFLSRGVKG